MRFLGEKDLAMILPKLPGRFIPFLATWALVTLAGFCAAADSIMLNPTLDPPQEKAPVDKKPPANAYPPNGVPYAPLVFNNDMWGNFLDRQNAYLVKLGEVEQDPRGRNIHVFA